MTATRSELDPQRPQGGIFRPSLHGRILTLLSAECIRALMGERRQRTASAQLLGVSYSRTRCSLSWLP